MSKPKGWKNESMNHSMASRGIKTKSDGIKKNIKWKRLTKDEAETIVLQSDIYSTDIKYGWQLPDGKYFIVTKYFEPENSKYIAYNFWLETKREQKIGGTYYSFYPTEECYGITEMKYLLEKTMEKYK